MSQARFDRSIHQKLHEMVEEKAAPGFQLALGYKDRTIGLYQVGYRDLEKIKKVKPSTLFDLASLTKVISTVTLVMHLRQRGLLESFELPIHRWLPSLQSELRHCRLMDLLNHRSGLKPIFEETDDLHESREDRVRFFLKRIDEDYSAAERGKTVYSDVGYMLLGILLESATEKRLRDLFLETTGSQKCLSYGPLQFPFEFLSSCWRVPHLALAQSLEEPRIWLKGIPQDPRAQWMGGDAGHAGVFGTAFAVEAWGRELWMAYQGKSVRRSDRVVRELLDCRPDFDRFRGGFDTPSGASQTGQYASPRDWIGHLGYTGCSFWMHLEKGFRVTLLSHRHAPGHDPLQLNKSRPRFHDWLQENVFSKLAL
jgi:CubicO group peptidase (beta-lactamase class C family)